MGVPAVAGAGSPGEGVTDETLDECFAHPLWPAFERHLWSTHRCKQASWFRYVDHEAWWRPLWETFLAGARALGEKVANRG